MYILYGIAIISVVGILCLCISYTDGTVPIDTPQQKTYSANPKRTLKKKSCVCCDDKQKRMHEMMREWLNEKPQANLSNKVLSATGADPE